MLLIGLKNTGEQTVLATGQVNIGNVYRKFCKANRCGVPAFAVTSNGVTLQQEGIYHITATFESAAAATVPSLEVMVSSAAATGSTAKVAVSINTAKRTARNLRIVSTFLFILVSLL